MTTAPFGPDRIASWHRCLEPGRHLEAGGGSQVGKFPVAAPVKMTLP